MTKNEKQEYVKIVKRINNRLNSLQKNLGSGSYTVQHYQALIDSYNLKLTVSGNISTSITDSDIRALKHLDRLPTYLDLFKAEMERTGSNTYVDIKQSLIDTQETTQSFNELLERIPYDKIIKGNSEISDIIFHSGRTISYDEMKKVVEHFNKIDLTTENLFDGME